MRNKIKICNSQQLSLHIFDTFHDDRVRIKLIFEEIIRVNSPFELATCEWHVAKNVTSSKLFRMDNFAKFWPRFCDLRLGEVFSRNHYYFFKWLRTIEASQIFCQVLVVLVCCTQSNSTISIFLQEKVKKVN